MGRVAVAGDDKGRVVAVLFAGLRGDGRNGDCRGWGVGGGTLGSWS